MHQPPTIPEGDEENEGGEQGIEGTRFPQTVSSQQSSGPLAHDSLSTPSELQPREDEGVGYGHTPTLQNEMIAVSGDISTEAAQQAFYEQPSSVETPIIDDGAKLGAPETDTENEIEGQLDEGGALAGITEEEGAVDETHMMTGVDKTLTALPESPVPPAEETSSAVIPSEEEQKSGEIMPISISPDEHRRSAMSGRDRSARAQRETPQVEFETVTPAEHEEEQDIVPEEPEIHISREEILARYQAAETERDRLRSNNLALQQRLADYLHKRKGAEDLPTLAQANERSSTEQQQRYQKYLAEIETLQDRLKRDQADYEKKRNEYEHQIEMKKERVEQLKQDYVKLIREIASKAVFSRTGKTLSSQEVENYLTLLNEKEDELIKTRHENIRLKNQLKKRESQLKSKEELAEGLHMIDFEQLKIENQTYSEKIEERNEELMKLRKKISTTVQILSHIKEKLSFVSEQGSQAAQLLEEKEREVKQKRDELATIKHRRDRLRQENQSLKQNSGLIGNEQLLRDYEDRYDDIEQRTEKLELLKKRHAEITLMCKVLKKKISKV